MHIRFFLLLVLGILPTAHGQHPAKETVSNFTVDSNEYVIASDRLIAAAGYDRDLITTSGSASIELLPGQSAQTIRYRVSYQLISDLNQLARLEFPDGKEGTTFVSGLFNVNLTSGNAQMIPFQPSLRPAETLSPRREYRVRQLLETQDSRGNWIVRNTADTAARPFYHFPSLDSSDASLNTLVVIDNIVWTDRTANQSARMAADGAFTGRVSMTLHRYDSFSPNSPPPRTNLVATELGYSLRRSSDNAERPIEISSASQQYNVAQHVNNGPLKVPSTLNVVTNIRLAPTVQLQSVSEEFFIDSRVTNNDGKEITREGGTRSSAIAKLMHIEGTVTNLTPDVIVTTFRSDPLDDARFLANDIRFTNKIAAGNLVGRADLTIRSDPSSAISPISFRLYDDGHLVAINSNSIEVSPSTDPVPGTADGFTFSRSNLSFNGGSQLQGTISLTLPAGLGYYFGTSGESYSGVLESSLESNSVLLDQNLNPASSIGFTPPFPPSGGSYYGLVEESKPLGVTCSSIVWNRTSGIILPGPAAPFVERIVYLRKDEIEILAEATELTADDRTLRSNELFYQNIRSIGLVAYTADPTNSSARMTATTAVAPTTFRSHFPFDATVTWEADGNLGILRDVPDFSNSRLESTTELIVPYSRDCEKLSDLGCGQIGMANHRVNVPTGITLITPDGGLWAAGTPTTSGGAHRDIEISFLSEVPGPDSFAHETGEFTTQSRFFMAGHSLDALTTTDLDSGPAILLNSGFHVQSFSMHRPHTQDYRDGQADYPGVNYRASTESGMTSTATLGGNTTVPFPLRDRSKYYLRYGGTSGIHEAEPGGFPSTVTISSYPFQIDHFGLSFLDSELKTSTTSGSIAFPAPTDFTFAFDSLRFDCLGLPETTPPSPGSSDSELKYWAADTVLQGLDFQTVVGSECDPSNARAVVGMRAFASNISSPMHGSLGIDSDGTIITPSTELLAGIDSRFALPNTVTFDGPREEKYTFTALHHAWLNRAAEPRTDGLGTGTLNLGGLVDVPFFEDLQVHLQTGSKEDNNFDEIFMMAGWTDDEGNNLFNSAEFDRAHRSTPVAIEEYRDLENNPIYRVHARQDWLDIVPFDYPLDWNSTTRSFKASEPHSLKLMVVNAEHNLTYMSAEIVEIDFGANLNASISIPEVNIENLASTVFELTGLNTAAGDAIGGLLNDGIDSLAALANDRLNELFDQAFEKLDEPIDALADSIINANEDLDAIEALLEARLYGASDSIFTELKDLVSQAEQTTNLLGEIDEALGKAQWGIRAAIGSIPASGDIDLSEISENLTVPEDAIGIAVNARIGGLFAKQEGAGYALVRNLVVALINDLGGDAAGGLNAISGSVLATVEDELNVLLAEAEPTLEDVKTVLMDIHNAIGDIRREIQAGSGIAEDLLSTFEDAVVEIETFMIDAKEELFSYLSQVRIPELDAEELKTRIRLAIRDRFNASGLIADVQVILKQYVQDIEGAVNEAISTLFAEVNKMVVKLIADAIPDFQEKLEGMTDDLNKLAATGNIEGYARINGDALRTLRLDAALQLKIPSEFEFGGYLEINQLDSQGDGGCSYQLDDPNAYAAEVKMGANCIPVQFLGSKLRFNIGCKFSFDTDGGFSLRGMGGSIELVDGTISIQAVTIFELGAAAAFGIDENYLAARVGFTFDQYTMAGGVFFGRSCSLDPLLIADPDVGEVLGLPPFTGLYSYGEAQVPIVGASCFFSLQANAGAGVFVFTEGPTIGGKIKMGIAGEALCAVTVGGDLTLIGAKVGNAFNFFGRGRIFGSIGKDPLSIGFDEDVEVTFKDGSWDYDF